MYYSDNSGCELLGTTKYMLQLRILTYELLSVNIYIAAFQELMEISFILQKNLGRILWTLFLWLRVMESFWILDLFSVKQEGKNIHFMLHVWTFYETILVKRPAHCQVWYKCQNFMIAKNLLFNNMMNEKDWIFCVFQSLTLLSKKFISSRTGLKIKWGTDLNHKPQLELLHIDFFLIIKYFFQIYISQQFPLHHCWLRFTLRCCL